MNVTKEVPPQIRIRDNSLSHHISITAFKLKEIIKNCSFKHALLEKGGAHSLTNPKHLYVTTSANLLSKGSKKLISETC